MDAASPNAGVAPASLALIPDLAAYREPDSARSVLELLITVIPFALLWTVMWIALDAGIWIALVLVILLDVLRDHPQLAAVGRLSLLRRPDGALRRRLPTPHILSRGACLSSMAGALASG